MTIRPLGKACLAWCLAASFALGNGFLSVETTPAGAEVWYTGPYERNPKYLGDTPLDNRELPAGNYDLWLILSNHDTVEVAGVYIAEGQTTNVKREIASHYAFLEVTTRPDSCEIWLDGTLIGPSPYVNSLVIPGVYKLKVDPRESQYRSSSRKIRIAAGDSIRMLVDSPHRTKSFLTRNLSIPPWSIQLETGLQHRTRVGVYDTAGKQDKVPTDSIRKQLDFPIGVRLGFPGGVEAHLMLPFKSYKDLGENNDAPFPSNLEFGLKYTYRPLGIGLDGTYGVGFKNGVSALNHDFLSLTAMIMASKEDILGEAQAGFEFHFAEKKNNQMDPGDVARLHVQIGYVVDPWLPYLGAGARVQLKGNNNGDSVPLSDNHVLYLEPGVIVYVVDLLALQLGIPFTVVGKNFADDYWGIHGSLALSFNIF